MEAMFLVGGVIGVLVTLAWLEVLAHHARVMAKRAECEVRGHQWEAPFPSAHGTHRNCRHCKQQSHQKRDGGWTIK